MRRDIFTEDHEAYRQMVRSYLDREITPHVERWEEERSVDRHAWKVAGQQGIIGMTVPAEYGDEVMKLIIGRDLTGLR